jgi:hypothetical protein
MGIELYNSWLESSQTRVLLPFLVVRSGEQYGIQIGAGAGGTGGFNIAPYYSTMFKIKCEQCIETSSKEMKHDIKPLSSCGAIIDKLRPVSFIYNKDEEEKTVFGLIHEETVDVVPEICFGNESKKAEDKGISYTGLIPILLKEIQDLRKRVAELERVIPCMS